MSRYVTHPNILMKPDIDIIMACKKGDERAYFALFSLCYGHMKSICIRYLGDELEADGAVNKAFLKIVMNLDKWDVKRPFEAWARTITVNTALDACRKKKSQSKNMPLTPIDDAGNDNNIISINEADEKLNAELLERMIYELPDMHKQVFNLFALDGFSHKEIAEKLDCSVSASKWYLHQARKILQEKLDVFLMNEKKYQHG